MMRSGFIQDFHSLQRPMAIRTALYGPQSPRDQVVFYITAAAGIVVSLIVIGALYIMGGQ